MKFINIPINSASSKEPVIIRLNSRPFKKTTLSELINYESIIGSYIFGNLPKGRERRFYNYDENNWIWYEAWNDENRKRHEIVTRYEIQDHQIIKIQPGPRYKVIEGKELDNFYKSVKIYYKLITKSIYGTES